jgi:hypothetical protein
MNKFFEWVGRHHKTIGYVCGGATAGCGIGLIVNGSVWTGVFFIVLGVALTFDATRIK